MFQKENMTNSYTFAATQDVAPRFCVKWQMWPDKIDGSYRKQPPIRSSASPIVPTLRLSSPTSLLATPSLADSS